MQKVKLILVDTQKQRPDEYFYFDTEGEAEAYALTKSNGWYEIWVWDSVEEAYRQEG